MTPQHYKSLRLRIGTQAEAAVVLDCHEKTICRRETGAEPITAGAEAIIRAAVAKLEKQKQER